MEVSRGREREGKVTSRRLDAETQTAPQWDKVRVKIVETWQKGDEWGKYQPRGILSLPPSCGFLPT